MRYPYTREETRIVEKFARDIDVSIYAFRDGQFDEEECRLQQKYGKYGELANYHYLKSKGINATYPDFTIYAAKDKTFDPDMSVKLIQQNTLGYMIHSKSQLNTKTIEFGGKYPQSWSFQMADNHIFKTYGPQDLVMFNLVTMMRRYVDVQAVISVQDLHKYNLFSLPQNEYLHATKRVILYDDLVKHFTNLFQK